MGFWTPVWGAAVEEDVYIIHLKEVCQRACAFRLGCARQRCERQHFSEGLFSKCPEATTKGKQNALLDWDWDWTQVPDPNLTRWFPTPTRMTGYG